MSKKILPISYPMITSWQWHATLFSIIGDDEKAKNWREQSLTAGCGKTR